MQDINILLQLGQLIFNLFFLHGEVGLFNEMSQREHINLGFLNIHSSVDGLLNVYDVNVFCFLDDLCLFMEDSALLLLTTQKLQSELDMLETDQSSRCTEFDNELNQL